MSTGAAAAGMSVGLTREGRRMDSPLHRFARQHGGVVTVATAAAFGYDWSRFRAIVRAEGWARVAPSAYALPGHAIDLRTRVHAEQLRHGAVAESPLVVSPVVASHRTAAALHGGDVLAPGFDFTVDGDGRYDVPGGTTYRWPLRPGDVARVEGLRVTTPARTAADLLRALPRDEAVIAVDGLLRCGAVTVDAVASRLERFAGHRYVRRAWEAFRHVDPRSGSVAESKVRLLLRDGGLWPRSQVTLLDVAGRRVRVDFWLGEGVAIEVEGYAFHSDRETHQADIARFNALAGVPGVTVLRFSWADAFHRPAAVVSAVRAALANGERRPAHQADR